MELTISGLGTDRPDAAVVWNGQAADTAAAAKRTALPTSIPAGLDVTTQSSSSVDVGVRGSGGTRLSATFKVRNAQACGTPGSCTTSNSVRKNLTYLATNTAAGIDGTAINNFRKFDLSNADPALALQLKPTHAINGSTLGVDDVMTQRNLLSFGSTGLSLIYEQ